MTDKVNKGTIRKVSPYGFLIEGNDNWFNIVKEKQKALTEILRKYIGDEISWETDSKGGINALIIKEEKIDDRPSLKIKIISGNNYKDIEKQFDLFGKNELIQYTQSICVGSELILICYYEPKN